MVVEEEENPYEAQARLQKAVALLGVLRRASKGGELDAQTLDCLDTADWLRVAEIASQKPPSPRTIALVKKLVSEGTAIPG